MPPFRELSERLTKNVDNTFFEMAHLRSIEDVEDYFVNNGSNLLSGECLAWNNWKSDWSGLTSASLNSHYHERFASLIDSFYATFPHHPMNTADWVQEASKHPLKLSDFQESRIFLENPIYKEVYRHLDSRYQLLASVCTLSDRHIIITLNRQKKDFSKRDMELLQYAGTRLALIAKGIDRNKFLEIEWRQLCELVGGKAHVDFFTSLKSRDLYLLDLIGKGYRIADIAQQQGVRRDTLDKRLGAIREHLGLENNRQLLRILSEMRHHKLSQST